MTAFVQALVKEKSISLEFQVEEVTVHANHKYYPNIAVRFLKSITVDGLSHISSYLLLKISQIHALRVGLLKGPAHSRENHHHWKRSKGR